MKRLLTSYLMVLASQGLRLLGLIGTQLIVMHAAGETALGHFSYLFALFTLLGIFFDWGAGPAAARRIALVASERDQRQYVAAMVRMLLTPLLFYQLVSLLAVLLAARLVSYDLLVPGLCGALLTAGMALQIPLRDLLSGRQNLLALSVLNGAPHILATVGLLLLLPLGSVSVLTATALTTLAHTGVCVWLLWRAGAASRTTPAALDELRAERRKHGMGVSLGRMLGTGGFLLDMPILGLYWPASQVAFYAAIKAVSNPFAAASSTLGTVLFSQLVRSDRIPRALQTINWVYSGLIAVVLLGLGPWVLGRLYGFDSQVLHLALLIQTVGIVVQSLYTVYGTFLLAQGRGWLLGVGGSCFGALRLGSNLWLIPLLGAEGACLSNTACNIAWFAFCLLGYRSLMKRTPELVTSKGEATPVLVYRNAA